MKKYNFWKRVEKQKRDQQRDEKDEQHIDEKRLNELDKEKK